jgi:SAM-dependent methyltransferase
MSGALDRARAASRAWRSYAGAPASARALLLARLAVLPLADLDRDLRALSGRVLSVGAGHGVLERYLAEINLDVAVDGVELDVERVRIAAATEARAPRVRIHPGDALALDRYTQFDAVLVVDLMHHLAGPAQETVLPALGSCLKPHGVLLIKDIAATPRWRWMVNRAHDRIVAGPEPILCRDPAEMARMVERAGLVVEAARRLRHPSPYPHYLVRARAPVRPGEPVHAREATGMFEA